jgi:acyl-CoA thioesterase-1
MTARLRLALILAPLAFVFSGCSHDVPYAPPSHDSQKPSAEVAIKPRQKKIDSRPAIVIFGDSLSAGFGLDPGLSYPDHLQELLDAKGYAYRVVNQGLSGDTSSGGLSRIDECLTEKPQIVLVELGGNDGLRGIPVAITRSNLDAIIQRSQASGAKVVLAGITLPRNYGDDYIREFDRIFPELAKKYDVPLIPFLLEGLASPAGIVPGMIQVDGIHPTAKGTPIIARTVFAKLEPLLKH